MRFGFGFAAAALLLLSACGQHSSHAASSTAAVNPADASFVNNAAMFENYAIRAAQIAQTQSQADAVKTYAAASITEHTTALQQLAQAAHDSGLAAPNDALDDNYQQYLTMLQHQTPQTFDTTFASQLSIAYLSAAGQYDGYIASADDSPLRTWAQSQSQRLHDGIASAHALAAGSSDD